MLLLPNRPSQLRRIHFVLTRSPGIGRLGNLYPFEPRLVVCRPLQSMVDYLIRLLRTESFGRPLFPSIEREAGVSFKRRYEDP